MKREKIKIFLLENFEKVDGFIRQKLYFRHREIFDSIFDVTNYLPEKASFLERLYNIMNDIYEKPFCKYCKKNKVNFGGNNVGYLDFCGSKCFSNSDQVKKKKIETNLKKYGTNYVLQNDLVKEKIKKTCIDKYGSYSHNRSDSIKEKKKKSYIKKYGVENPSQSKEIKEKKKETCFLHFGVDSPLKNDYIKDKISATCFEKYGKNNALQVKYFRDKGKQTSIKKYGEDHYCKTNEYKQKVREKFFEEIFSKFLKYRKLELLEDNFIHLNEIYRWKCLVCNKEFEARYNVLRDGYLCPHCYPRNISKYEIDIKNEIEKFYNGIIILNSRNIINPYEIDIYIPDKNIAIEFNGLYWHSEEFMSDKNYHLNKTNLCNEKGLRLIHIFEDEWIFKKEIVKSRLKQILGFNDSIKINARDCKIKEIDPKIKNKFLEKFHIQGKDASKIKLGAIYKDELISVMTFSISNISRSFYKKENFYELSRFCSNHNYHIPGIASKLLEYFKRNYEWEEIFTYADKRWSIGNLYYKLSFNYVHDTKPNYWYIKDGMRIHRFNLRKKKDEPKEISESILRQSEGYRKIWDCGNIKFSMEKK